MIQSALKPTRVRGVPEEKYRMVACSAFSSAAVTGEIFGGVCTCVSMCGVCGGWGVGGMCVGMDMDMGMDMGMG